jgi:hypothetical protein
MMTGLALLALSLSAAGAARPARAGSFYTLKDLGTLPGGTNSSGWVVNASGQVTGQSNSGGNIATHAFLSGPAVGRWKTSAPSAGPAAPAEPSTPPAKSSDLRTSRATWRRAFLYSGGRMLDLNSLIAPGSGFTLTSALGISDLGYIGSRPQKKTAIGPLLLPIDPGPPRTSHRPPRRPIPPEGRSFLQTLRAS